MKKIFVVLFFLPVMSLFSQVHLGISSTSFSIYSNPANAFTDDTLNIYVVNSGSSMFADNLDLNIAVQDSAASTFHLADSVSLGFDSIAAGDSASFNVWQYLDISPARYHYDINVIVIWPYAPSASVVDSLTFTLFILGPDGVSDIDVSSLVNAYPNPVSGNLTLDVGQTNVIEEVRIYDAGGRFITSSADACLDASSWSAGRYILRVKLRDGTESSIHIIKR